ncbi:MAG: hypothetical protein WC586_11835 [Methanoregula sp.]
MHDISLCDFVINIKEYFYIAGFPEISAASQPAGNPGRTAKNVGRVLYLSK